MRHYIIGIEVTPRNIGDIGIRSVFGDTFDELSVNVDNILLTREDYEIVKQHIQQLGFFEGLPYQMVTNSGITIDYYIDLQERPIFRDFEVELKLKKRYGSDQFWEKANGTSFELIAKTLTFPTFDTPYIIVKDNQAEMAISLAITLFLMTKETIDATKQLITSISDLIGAVTPNVGAGVTMDIGDIITQVIKIIFQIAYIALLIAALVKLSQQLFELIFPKIRYLKACKDKDLISVGCQYLGYKFSSTLLDSIPGLSTLPVPLKKQSKKWFEFTQNELNQSFNKGYPTASDSTPTLGAHLESLREQFNGRIRIIGDTVHLERRDFWSTTTQNTMLPALALQDSRSDEYTVNTDEAWKRMYIHYESDISDLHTFDNFEGVDAEYSAEPLTTVNQDLFSIKGIREISIPFAPGARKDKLNWLEKLVKNLFKSIDNLVNKLGGSSQLVAKIDNRIGVLVISQQYFNKTKKLYCIGGKQPANYLNYIRASVIFDNYYSIDRIEVNGYKIREQVPVAINDEDFVSLLNNNFASINGVVNEITEFEYIEDSKTMLISYREPYNYANGKIQTIMING